MSLSLLWPGTPPPPRTAYDLADLHLQHLVDVLTINPKYRRDMQTILHNPVMDEATLRYRQDVIDDLLRIPDVTQRLTELLDMLIALEGYMVTPQWEQSELRKVAWRLSELEQYVNCIDLINESLAGRDLQSAALIALRDLAAATADSEAFIALKAELPDLLAQIRGIKSITIGVNLDGQLRPIEATLLSVNTEKFTGETPAFLNLFLGSSQDDPNQGVGPLHRAERGSGRFSARMPENDNPLLQPLFRDLAAVMDRICIPISQALRRYVRVSGGTLVTLQTGIAFYLGAIQVIQHLQACGLPMCRPEIAPMDDRECQLEGVYNINFALRMSTPDPRPLEQEIILNDASFDQQGRIFILTGPNRGGKTTYTQAVGLAQAMFQAGLYVPARRARMSAADAIFTHFAAAERPELEAGRLGEEARRLSAIFEKATRHSLILLNESFASTSAGESFYLARDIVRVIRVLGARAIFATHLHELAADADNLNRETPGDSAVVSLVSMVRVEENNGDGSAKRTYKIVPSPPMGKSYAREIAARYGVSFEQLTDVLRERKAID